MIGSETAGLVELALAGSEGRDVAAVGLRELDRHVPEPADADDADVAGRLGVHDERVENGDAAAQERTGLGDVQSLRQRNRPRPVAAHVRGEAAAMADDRRLSRQAQVLVAGQALPAVHATAGSTSRYRRAGRP